ncbi:MAG: triose-phosphate isomerase [Alphaproteobacteria bacterium]|nr:triose-phosphate isomerase [Alphaproteobacteria bacterium]
MAAPKNSPTIRALVAGNWKMNGSKKDLSELRKLATALKPSKSKGRVKADVMICPPATLLPRMADQKAKGSALGGQDCHANISGAHTGDISADMLKQAGAKAVIIGHSERRADHGETDKQVRAKVEAAHRAGLLAIMCVGESLKQRKAGETLKVVQGQLRGSLPAGCTAKNTVIAYEPVWAIGSGLTPTAAQVGEVHAALRKALVRRFGDEGAKMRILYGGSVKPANAAELMAVPHVNGALVGGASLKAQDFYGILKAYL